MVETVLRRRGVTLDQVRGVVVSDGPGSFTGLRVGAAAAKALARSRDIPLWTAPSLLVRAAGVAGSDRSRVLAVSDALRGDLYALVARFDAAGGIETELGPGVWRPEGLAELDLRPDALVGEAPPEAAALLERRTGLRLVGPPEGAPHAAKLIDLAMTHGGARRVEDPASWEPFYGRPAEAQARWEMTHGRPLPDSVGGAR